jgi:ketosteroid isomerase-like protein
VAERSNDFDFVGFKAAMERKDVDSWFGFYADEAEWIEYRHFSPPRDPNRMLGKEQIADFIRRVCSSDVDIIVADEVIASDRIAFSIAVALPDGKRIFEHIIADIENGKITRQVDVEAWD